MKTKQPCVIAHLFFTLFVALLAPVQAQLDLEDKAQDFVLETKRIELPEYPYAFNPAIIRWQGALLLSFRIIPDIKQKYTSYICLVWLTEDFEPASRPQILEMPRMPGVPSRAEDARLTGIGDRLFMVYSDNKEEKISRGGCRVYVAELHCNGNIFSVVSDECLSQFEGESKDRREKNWTPFEFQGHMLLAYSLDPHCILRPLLDGSGICEEFVSSHCSFIWDWGELRGGSPALAIDSSCYLAFFHSSKDMQSVHSDGKTVAHYFMGAYTFAPDPPFNLLSISPHPIVGKNFYHGISYEPYWKPVRCVFPCGYVFDDNYIWVVYGRQDHEMWVAKLDKKALLESLIPVLSIP